MDRRQMLAAAVAVAAPLVRAQADYPDRPVRIIVPFGPGALTGTFLGVLLAYGMVGPFASRLKGVVEEESKYYEVIRAVLVAHLHGNAAQISVEIGRGNVPSGAQPSFLELEEALSAIPAEGA